MSCTGCKGSKAVYGKMTHFSLDLLPELTVSQWVNWLNNKFQVLFIKHDVHFVNYGPIYNKIDDEVGNDLLYCVSTLG